MKKTRILSIVLAAAMLCSLLSGCMGGKTVMKVGGNAISEEIYSSALTYTNDMFQQNYGFSVADALDEEMGDGTTGADMLKGQADDLLKEFESVLLYAKEKGIEFTKEDKDQMKAAKQAQIDSAGGRKAFLDNIKGMGMNEAFYDHILERQQIYSKVYTELFTGEGEFAPSAEEVAASLEGFARVKHVLIKAEEGAEDYEAKKAEAQKIADRAKAGEDFDALIAEVAANGDGDPGMQSNPEGYVIDESGYTPDGSSQMVTEFTTASHALEVNGVSDIVPSDFGFHVIKRYPFDEAYITEHYTEYSMAAADTAFAEELTAFMENIEVEYTDAYDEIDVHAIFGVEKANGADTGTADGEEHFEGDGHDHSADAEGEGDADAEGDAGIESAAGADAPAAE